MFAFDKVIVGAGISGTSCFHWLAKHHKTSSVALLDKWHYSPKPVQAPLDVNPGSYNASAASGCWVLPSSTKSERKTVPRLLQDCNSIALHFYDSVDSHGTSIPWKLVHLRTTQQISQGDRTSGFPTALLDVDGTHIQGRYFENPGNELLNIITKSVSIRPNMKYFSDLHVSRMQPIITSGKKFEGWKLESATHPDILAKEVILAIGSDIFNDGAWHVPELQYFRDSLTTKRGSTVDICSNSPFPRFGIQTDRVLSPLTALRKDEPLDPELPFQARFVAEQHKYGKFVGLDIEQSIAALHKAFPQLLPQHIKPFRILSGDRLLRGSSLPVVGPVLDTLAVLRSQKLLSHGAHLDPYSQVLPGLYYIGALGSKGFTTGPVLAKMLVKLMQGNFNDGEDEQIDHIMNEWYPILSTHSLLQRWVRKQGLKEFNNQRAWQIEL